MVSGLADSGKQHLTLLRQHYLLSLKRAHYTQGHTVK